ncbi:hypothetical protein VHEMI10659 [[Torrubiella] hemipterigena]|nr:hypothetical protein VHEMI10659 [[Torrubiella] hemipterigena]
MLKEVLPKEWHFVESRQFIRSVIQPYLMKTQLIPNATSIGYSTDPKSPAKMDGLIACTLALRVAIASVQNGNRIKPCRNPSNSHIWNRLYRHINGAIESINHALAAEDSGPDFTILENINSLRQVEIVLQSHTWRSHSEAYLQLLRMYFTNLLGTLSTRYATNTHDLMFEVIMSETVSPPKTHLAGISRFSRAEILSVVSSNCHPGLPCPSTLLQEILAVTELRQRIAAATITGRSLDAEIMAVFRRIEAFVPETWTESYPIPDVLETRRLAQIFKESVALYALATLPTDTLPTMMPLQLLIDKKRDNLCTLIDSIWANRKCRVSLNWPLAVVGYAMATGSAVQQRRICTFLDNIAMDPLINHSLMIKERLVRFWASGKKAWDECWQDGFAVIY